MCLTPSSDYCCPAQKNAPTIHMLHQNLSDVHVITNQQRMHQAMHTALMTHMDPKNSQTLPALVQPELVGIQASKATISLSVSIYLSPIL